MRLLHGNTDGSFSLTTFPSNCTPCYAVLSHTWEADDQEVTFEDLVNGVGNLKSGYGKIRFCAERAQMDGLRYFWVDSCCIDKSSSAELSEAINTMFLWYQNAAKCYVYLADVRAGKSAGHQWESAFCRSRWFTRGWTLQELLAPSSVEFFSQDGTKLGDKESLKLQVHKVTGIAAHALQGSRLPQFSVEERMSWAVRRETTIAEDHAYCLFGIFGVHLPLIYGEGKTNALCRLRDEIDKRSEANSVKDPTQYERDIRWSQKELDCLRALRTSEYELFKDRNPDRLEGTCQWFLQHDSFQQWQRSSSSSLLWVSADPGCGKSVLAKSLIDLEMKSNESRTTCYFFFKDDNDKQKSLSTALSALLHQLFSQKQSLMQHAMPDYNAEGDKLSQSFHKLWSILTKATSDPTAREVVCILDALDECAELGRYEIIDALSAFYKHSTSRQSTSRLKFLVTSRPYFDIERRFANLIRQFPTIRLHGEKESKAISHEINIVVKSKASELAQELQLDNLERSTLEDGLLSTTHRTYLWLKLIVEVIRDEIGFTKNKLKQIIGTLPATVDQAYEAILSRVRDKDKKKVQKLLHIIVVAHRPLTLKEMNIALAIEDHHKCCGDLDLEEDKRFGSSVRDLCGLFVSVVDQKVYLIHQTAKEFLVGTSKALTGQWKHSLDPVESNLTMARACIAYLSWTVFDNESISGDEPGFQVAMQYGFLNYAACFWATHFRRAQNKAPRELLQSNLHICDTQSQRFWNWFRVYWYTEHKFHMVPKFTHKLSVLSFLGHEVVVKLLLETSKTDINSGGMVKCRTPLSWAAEMGNDAVVKLLLETGQADVNLDGGIWGRTPLWRAAGVGNDAVVKLLLETGKADVSSRDSKRGQTPLSRAVAMRRDAVVKLLLETGNAGVNLEDRGGRTALSWAAEMGNDAVAKLLLETGKADVNLQDDRGRTPLLWAAKMGKDAVVKLLLEEGKVDVDVKDNGGRTPLWWAAEDGNDATVKPLLETGKADVNSRDSKRGRTPLSRAAKMGNDAVVKLLLEEGKVNVDLKDEGGRTPLHWAVRLKKQRVVRLLLETGKADINSEDNFGQTPLSQATMNGDTDMLKLLRSAVRD